MKRDVNNVVDTACASVTVRHAYLDHVFHHCTSNDGVLVLYHCRVGESHTTAI